MIIVGFWWRANNQNAFTAFEREGAGPPPDPG